MAAPQMGYNVRLLGRALRKIGQGLDKVGTEVMGKEGYTEKREYYYAVSVTRLHGSTTACFEVSQ